MCNYDELLKTMPVERHSHPVGYPACSKAEIKYAAYLSNQIINGSKVSTCIAKVRVNDENHSILRTKVLVKPGFGLSTALVLNCSNPSLEGMILSEPIKGSEREICRPIYSQASHSLEPNAEADEAYLEKKLNYLCLHFPDADHPYINLLMQLISLSRLSIGNNFYDNIMNFSDQLFSTMPGIILQNWRI